MTQMTIESGKELKHLCYCIARMSTDVQTKIAW